MRIARRLLAPLILLALAGAMLLSPAVAAADPGDQASFTGSCSGTSCTVHGNNTGSTELFFAVLRWANGGAPSSASASDPNAVCNVGQFPGGQWATACQWSGASGGWGSGEPLDITTNFPADGLPSGLQEGCVSSTGTSDVCQQFDVGSPQGALRYDLEVKPTTDELVQVTRPDPDFFYAWGHEELEARWDIWNSEKAQRSSDAVTFDIAVSGSPHLVALVEHDCPCPVPALAPAEVIVGGEVWLEFYERRKGKVVGLEISEGGHVSLSASVTCDQALELGCENNFWPPAGAPGVLWVVHLANDSKIGKADADGVSGKAGAAPARASSARAKPGRAVKQVEVAILRLAPGLKPQKGPVDRRAAAAAKRSCEWVKNPKAQFARRPASDGVCDSHVWLKARGTSKWEFELKRDLPPGAYVAYSRATTKAGSRELGFSAKDGNLKKFTVR